MTRVLRRAVVRLLDALLPGLGMLWDGRRRAGWNTLMVWASLPTFLGTAVAFLGLDPRRAVVVLAVVWASLQAMLLAEPPSQDEAPDPLRALAGLAAWAALLLAAALAFSRSVTLATMPDHACWPGLLPGEVVLVHRADWGEGAPERGTLVAARAGDRRIVARVVGLPGERVEVDGPGLRLNAAEVPSEDRGEVSLSDGVAEASEGRHLRAWAETLDDVTHLAFHARGVSMPPRRADVPAGHVFLLADNRSTADVADSRTLGPAPLSDVDGPVQAVMWSPGEGPLPRWERLGLRWP
jgi:signal peptidase I